MAQKKGCLGCSFPLLIGIVIVVLALFIFGFAGGAIGNSLFFGEDNPPPAWLEYIIIDEPHPELPPETVFYLFGNHSLPITNTVIGAWITMAFLVIFSWAVTRRLKLIPGRLQAAFEFLLGWLYDFCQSVAGEVNGRRFFPIVATLFMFVAFNAWLGLIPGFGSIEITNPEGHHVHLLRAANTDINLPLALALATFIFTFFFGFKFFGLGFMKQYLNFGGLFRSIGLMFRGRLKEGFGGAFNGFIAAFVGLLELISVFIRIVSLTFRLFGNMTAGEILLMVIAFLLPFLVSLPFYGLELLVGFLQGLIFAGLTLVYLTMTATSHSEEH